eukprot:Amastigsp_a1293_24.p4 type:complete len:101 gc:universal Amastigsp_a1293_24:457-155(-)
MYPRPNRCTPCTDQLSRCRRASELTRNDASSATATSVIAAAPAFRTEGGQTTCDRSSLALGGDARGQPSHRRHAHPAPPKRTGVSPLLRMSAFMAQRAQR